MKSFCRGAGPWLADKFNLYTAKGRAICAAIVAGLASFAGSMVEVPPELQNKVIYDVANVIPFNWRGTFIAAMKAIFSLMLFYAVHQAAHAGPGGHRPPLVDPCDGPHGEANDRDASSRP